MIAAATSTPCGHHNIMLFMPPPPQPTYGTNGWGIQGVINWPQRCVPSTSPSPSPPIMSALLAN